MLRQFPAGGQFFPRPKPARQNAFRHQALHLLLQGSLDIGVEIETVYGDCHDWTYPVLSVGLMPCIAAGTENVNALAP
jgi:hypothetical protein